LNANNQAHGHLLDFKYEEIEEYLNQFKKCINNGNYTISLNEKRLENKGFIEDYKINKKKEKEVLLSLEADDFCYAVNNDNEYFAHEVLYIFCKQYTLDYWGTLEDVDIYIKINMIEVKNRDTFSVVVSFHKRNFEMHYLFK